MKLTICEVLLFFFFQPFCSLLGQHAIEVLGNQELACCPPFKKIDFNLDKGRPNGDINFYYENGKNKARGKLLNGRMIGNWMVFDTNGVLMHQRKYLDPWSFVIATKHNGFNDINNPYLKASNWSRKGIIELLLGRKFEYDDAFYRKQSLFKLDESINSNNYFFGEDFQGLIVKYLRNKSFTMNPNSTVDSIKSGSHIFSFSEIISISDVYLLHTDVAFLNSLSHYSFFTEIGITFSLDKDETVTLFINLFDLKSELMKIKCEDENMENILNRCDIFNYIQYGYCAGIFYDLGTFASFIYDDLSMFQETFSRNKKYFDSFYFNHDLFDLEVDLWIEKYSLE